MCGITEEGEGTPVAHPHRQTPHYNTTLYRFDIFHQHLVLTTASPSPPLTYRPADSSPHPPLLSSSRQSIIRWRCLLHTRITYVDITVYLAQKTYYSTSTRVVIDKPVTHPQLPYVIKQGDEIYVPHVMNECSLFHSSLFSLPSPFPFFFFLFLFYCMNIGSVLNRLFISTRNVQAGTL